MLTVTLRLSTVAAWLYAGMIVYAGPVHAQRDSEPRATTPTSSLPKGDAPPTWKEITFDFVAKTVAETYYDPNLKGLDWPSLVASYRAQLPRANSSAQLYALLNRMLAELKDRHTNVVARAEAESQAQLQVTYDQRGIRLDEYEETIFVRSVLPGSAASNAGLHAGDRVTRINGKSAIAQFQARDQALVNHVMPRARARTQALAHIITVPSNIVLRLLARGADGVAREIEIAESPLPMPDAVETKFDAPDIQQIQLRRFRGDAMRELAAAIADKRARGFLIDLRGNSGGDLAVAMLLADRLLPKQSVMWTELSRSENPITKAPEMARKPWRFGGKAGARTEPTAILIDELCASACEVFTSGLRAAGRVRVFGHHSAGIVAGVAIKPIEMPDGAGLNVSKIGIVGANQEALDNVGIAPDESCVITPHALQQHEDCVYAIARKWLMGQIAY